MKYYYDSTWLDTTYENARVIVRTSNNFFDCERFDISSKKWVKDSNFSSKVFEGQKEVEEISESEAMKKINELI